MLRQIKPKGEAMTDEYWLFSITYDVEGNEHTDEIVSYYAVDIGLSINDAWHKALKHAANQCATIQSYDLSIRTIERLSAVEIDK